MQRNLCTNVSYAITRIISSNVNYLVIEYNLICRVLWSNYVFHCLIKIISVKIWETLKCATIMITPINLRHMC